MENLYFATSEFERALSFSAMVKDRFSDQLYAAIYQYAKLHNTELQSVTLTKVIVTALEREAVYANVLFSCNVGEQKRVIPASYIIDCFFSTSDEFSQIHIRCTTPAWPNRVEESVLPDTLVPYIPKDQMETVAKSILKELFPTALRNAVPVSAMSIALKLGLRVEYACVDLRDETLGMIFFEDSTIAVYDMIEEISRIINVKRGTILINRRPDGKFDPRITNNTILHECIHWILHKPAYLLHKANDPKLNAFACRRSSSVQRNETWSAYDWMEWQANSLAPRLLMPEWSTRMQVDQMLRRMETVPPKLRMDRIIEKLSSYYEVSRTLARIRLIELGYKDAELGYTAPAHYEIDFQDAVQEYAQNEAFRKTLNSGAYAYVDQRFCIRDKRYIHRADDGVLHLTEYAKAHEAECCLAFDYRRHAGWIPGGMQRDRKQTPQFVESAFTPHQFTQTVQGVTSSLKSLPLTFGETLEAHMQRKGMTQEQLAENSLLAVRSIRSYRSTEMPPIGLSRVVALCIGLKLHPLFCFDLVRKAGYRFGLTEEHVAYQILLGSMTHSSIYECNEFLRAAGIQPLGKED